MGGGYHIIYMEIRFRMQYPRTLLSVSCSYHLRACIKKPNPEQPRGTIEHPQPASARCACNSIDHKSLTKPRILKRFKIVTAYSCGGEHARAHMAV